ncbi:MAG: TRAP transporter small permease subunit [Alphaproteobacteria bacterium]|nr:TRAP transporter small permease subunit [Alphaproteobacteria bacterium]
MLDTLLWLAHHVLKGVTDFFGLLFSPSSWPDPSTSEGIVRIVHYGASIDLLFVILDLAIILLLIGLWRHGFLWRIVRIIEGISNGIGRIAAWVALIMVLQQIMIVALQRIFLVSEITIGPFGLVFTKDLSWFSEELKLYNALIVALCAAYTFVQGGHVRVDLVYSAVSFRKKRFIDMFGALLFVLPFTSVVWLFGWYFLWRHLITPKVAATDTLEALERKAQVIRWNVETIGFSPNGFDAYFLFKVLLVAFAALMFLQGLGHFYRSFLEFREGPDSADRYKDFDVSEESQPPQSADAGTNVPTEQGAPR